jgi:hypothetical protein
MCSSLVSFSGLPPDARQITGRVLELVTHIAGEEHLHVQALIAQPSVKS